MVGELELWAAKGRGALKKKGKFFALRPTYRGGATGLELENRKALVQPPRLILGPTILGT
ncbi:DUF1629 domain-containing protein [Mesorhizobium sp. NZP2077]|nr:DUF1629 domain-containing protein [Mesorhizobium sp. NZP2077]